MVDNQAVHSEVPGEGVDSEQIAVAATPRPCGAIVGIVRRNWRPYCGMLEASEDPTVSAVYESLFIVAVSLTPTVSLSLCLSLYLSLFLSFSLSLFLSVSLSLCLLSPPSMQNHTPWLRSHHGQARHRIFAPYDRRAPRIRVMTHQGAALTGMCIVVSIDGWPEDSALPLVRLLTARSLRVCYVFENELRNLCSRPMFTFSDVRQGSLRAYTGPCRRDSNGNRSRTD